MTQQTITKEESDASEPSVLRSLRALRPRRKLSMNEALRIADLQADRLLQLRGALNDIPVDSEIVAGLPRITVDYDSAMPCSGASDWDSHRRTWVITLNSREPSTRQRLSLLHEYKHILDNGSLGLIDLGDRTFFGHTPTEYLAEYFAGCVLMPKRQIKRAWYDGIQRNSDLAELFNVSGRAVQVRLRQLGLTDAPTIRLSLCSGPRPTRPYRHDRYQRQLSSNRPTILQLEISR